MDESDQTNKAGNRFDVSFGNGALKKLRELAAYLSIPEDRLGDVITKGIKILEAAKDANEDSIIIETKSGDKQIINIREL